MSKKKLIPEIRFKGYEKNLTTYKIEDLANVYDGTHQTPTYTDSGVMFVSVEDIETLKSEKFISEDDFIKDFKIYPEKNDVLMTRIGNIGKTNIVKTNAKLAYYVSLALLKPKGVNNKYLAYNIESLGTQKRIWQKTLHVAFPKKINKNEIGLIKIVIPEQLEQEKIGALFEKIDKAIELQEKLVEENKNFKKSMFQKMFPKKGKDIPEIRLNGYNFKWRQRKLGELSNISTGRKDVKDAVVNGEYPFYIRSEDILRINSYSYEGEAILIPGEGRLGEIFHYVNGKFDYHQRVYKISDFNESDAYFIYYYLQSHFKRHALSHSVKATVDSLRRPTITKFKVMLPILEEQKVIGSFFRSLDKKIELEEKKLENYKTLKKALLQKMFI